MRAFTLLDRISHRLRAASDADRRANPDRFTGAADGLGDDLLFAANVARMLGCNVDFVRRIPRYALPASKVGQRLIYSRADVEAYVRSQRDVGVVPTRGGGATPLPAPANSNRFDPVQMIRRAMEEKNQ